jgi:hypothetical protein
MKLKQIIIKIRRKDLYTATLIQNMVRGFDSDSKIQRSILINIH